MPQLDNGGTALPSRKRRRLHASDYQVACLFALEVELTPMRAMLDTIHDTPDIDYGSSSVAYTCGEIHHHNVVLAVLPRIGSNDSGVVANQLKNDFPSLLFGLLIGIAGGVPDPLHQRDIRLGDVVVSDWIDAMPGVVQFDRGKHHVSGFRRTGHLNHPPNLLLTTLRNVQSQHRQDGLNLDALVSRMIQQHPNLARSYMTPDVETDQLYDAEYEHRAGDATHEPCAYCDSSRIVNRASRPIVQPVAHYGTIGSSNSVLRDGRERERLKNDIPGLLAVEMEAAGLMNCLPCMVIKGICDYADSHKNKIWQPYAAATASAYAKEFLRAMPGSQPGCPAADLLRGSLTVEASKSSQTAANNSVFPHYEVLFKSLVFERMDARLRNVTDALRKTCTWLFNLPHFKSWAQRHELTRNKGFLWIKGKPGCGKSTMMKATYGWAKRAFKNEIHLVYFFNARATGILEKSSLGLFRSLTHQLLLAFPKTRHRFIEMFELKYQDEKVEEWSGEELKNFWNDIMQELKGESINIFIDALDEGNIHDIRQMISFLEDLTDSAYQESCHLRICLSSRHYPEIGLQSCLSIVMEDEKGHSQDIETYVKSKLRCDDSEDAETFRGQVCRRSSNIFLWIVLVIPMLNHTTLSGKLEERHKLLKELPADLDGLFERILARDDMDLEHTDFLLQWLLFSERPLTREEIYVATMATIFVVSGSNESTQRIKIPATKSLDLFIKDTSRGLAELTKSSQPVIQFIHETVRTFLLERGMQLICARGAVSIEGKSHDLLAKTCLLHVNAHATFVDEIQKSLPEEVRSRSGIKAAFDRWPLLEYATQHLFSHAESAERHGASQVPLLTRLNPTKLELWRWIEFRNCLQVYKARVYKECPPLLYILAEQDRPELCALLLSSGDNDMPTNARYGTALQAACAYGHERIVKLLISSGVDINVDHGEHSHPLFAAMYHKRRKIVQMLIQGGSIPSQEALNAQLFKMITRNNAEAVETLFNLGASTSCRNRSNQDPLQYALDRASDVHIIRIICNAWSDIDAVDLEVDGGETPLFWATRYDNVEAVRILLDCGNIHCDSYFSALWEAVNSHNFKIAKLLLEFGAYPSLSTKFFSNFLELAAAEGELELVHLLLQSRDDTVVPISSAGPALAVGLRQGRSEIVRLLLDSGVDTEHFKEFRDRALYSASRLGNNDMVALLLAEGADFNFNCQFYSNRETALQAASEAGNIEIVNRLLEAGADPNLEGGQYGTALVAALSCINFDCALRLIDAGADVRLSGRSANGLPGETALEAAHRMGILSASVGLEPENDEESDLDKVARALRKYETH